MLLGLIHPNQGTATFAGRRYEELAHPSAHVGAVLEHASFHPGRTGRNHLRVLAAAGDHPPSGSTTCSTRSDLTRRGRPPRQGLLDGDAPAPRHRRRPARRSRGADPRRADQRPRPARHPLGPRARARPGGARAGRARLQPPAVRGRPERRRRRRDRRADGCGPRAARRRARRRPGARHARAHAAAAHAAASSSTSTPSPSSATVATRCSSAARRRSWSARSPPSTASRWSSCDPRPARSKTPSSTLTGSQR